MDRRNVQNAAAVLALATLAVAIGLSVMGAPAPPSSSTSSPSLTAAPQTASPTPTISTPSPTPLPTATPVATPSSSQAGGTITGRFAYGSDFIPPVTVYAISTADSRVWYSVAFSGFGRPPRPTLPPGQTDARYTITGIAPGAYWVVAYRTDGQLPDPGYYSRQVECMRTTPSGPCPDINPVPVTVTSGQTASGIDVITWGTQPEPSPTLPPRPTPR